MSTLLITGGNGLLGSKLVVAGSGQHRVVALARRAPAYDGEDAVQWRQADIRDPAALSRVFREVCPDAVIHTAAMTDVDGCELRQEEAWETNVTATEHLAGAAKEAGAHLVFLSSDYVFSGEAGPYREGDPPGPLCHYGKTKLAAEQAVLELVPGSAVARTSLLYGYARHARANFVTWLVKNLREGRTATVVTDQIGSPTLAENLAEMLLAMVSQKAAGIYHATGPRWLNRHEYAQEVVGCFSLDRKLLRRARSHDLKQQAPRPRHSGLISDRVESELGVRRVDLQEGLQEVRRQMGESSPPPIP